MKHIHWLLFSVLLPGLGGCMLSGNLRPYPALEPLSPVEPIIQPATDGAIYRAGTELSLYSDHKARNVGDLLTITLFENTAAQTNANTNLNKNNSIDIAAPIVFGDAAAGKSLGISASAKRGFTGNGKSVQSNRLQGQVTVTVIQRLPNGNLVVAGQKQLRLNQGNELVQIQGIVRPLDIAPDNTVLSSKVADARIAYGGRGALAQANAQGWLARFFNHPIMPW